MNSNATASEYLLGKIGVEKIIKTNPARVLIGGLGLGFTLKSVLENTSNLVHVIVAEIIPEIIDWNRSYLTQLNGFLLNEPRVQVEQANVADLMFNTKNETYDSILLDLDNGPIPMTNNNNDFLYSVSGIKKIKSLLQDKGRLVIWSAGSDYNFENRLNFSSIKFKKFQPEFTITPKEQGTCSTYLNSLVRKQQFAGSIPATDSIFFLSFYSSLSESSFYDTDLPFLDLHSLD